MAYFADLSPYTYLDESPDVGSAINVGWLDAKHEFPRSDEAEVTLGFAEVRVKGAHGKVYAAPTLIHHYVVEHGYRPPDEFVAAVDGR